MHFYIKLPVVDMRESPSLISKVVSQALFGEKIEILDTKGEWSQILTPDDYKGWVLSLAIANFSSPYEKTDRISRLRAHLYQSPDIEYGPLITLPFGVGIQKKKQIDERWSELILPDQTIGYMQNGDIAPIRWPKNPADLPSFASLFLGLPYTWGGRSSFGYDCSGFIQMLYQEIGYLLRRDARVQIDDPRFQTIPLEQLLPGDLIFFGKSKKEIKHVALFLKEDRFIHFSSRECLPWCRISSLSDPEWCGREDRDFPYREARQLRNYN